MQNRLIQTSQTGGQWYSDTSPFSIPWAKDLKEKGLVMNKKCFIAMIPGYHSEMPGAMGCYPGCPYPPHWHLFQPGIEQSVANVIKLFMVVSYDFS